MKMNLLWVLALTLLLTACSKDDDPSMDDQNNNNNLNPTFSCKIDGVNFTSDDINADFFLVADVFDLSIVATEGSQTVDLEIGGFGYSLLEVGGFVPAIGYYRDSGNGINASTSDGLGITIDLTELDKDEQVISGTFNGTAKDLSSDISYEITDGVFTDIEY